MDPVYVYIIMFRDKMINWHIWKMWSPYSFLTCSLEEEIAVDSDDEFQYEEVPIDDDSIPPGNFYF